MQCLNAVLHSFTQMQTHTHMPTIPDISHGYINFTDTFIQSGTRRSSVGEHMGIHLIYLSNDARPDLQHSQTSDYNLYNTTKALHLNI